MQDSRSFPESYPQLPKPDTVENSLLQKRVLELAAMLDVQSLFYSNTLDGFWQPCPHQFPQTLSEGVLMVSNIPRQERPVYLIIFSLDVHFSTFKKSWSSIFLKHGQTVLYCTFLEFGSKCT